jgi:bacteriocin-like protein
MSTPKTPSGPVDASANVTDENELSEDALEQITGGTLTAANAPRGNTAWKVVNGLKVADDITTNKAKTAEKTAQAMDAYIKQ